jgi:LacI family transcriptional regulator
VKRPGRTTIADVARHAGVDRAVVSKVLSGDGALRVREETRERVRRAAAELRYLPNFHARGLARARSGAIGLLMPAGNPLVISVMSGAEEVAAERGLLLWTATHEGELSERYLRLLQGGAVDAVLVAGLRADVDADVLFADPRVPAILVNRRSRGAERWVILDDERAAQLATRYLIEHGHVRIAFAGGPSGVDTAERRRSGFLAAMHEAGLVVDDHLVVSAEYTPEGGAWAVARFMDAAAAPTAVVAADANEALGIWHALDVRGLSVPDDVSIIGIHRLPGEEYRIPPMTCVRMPLHGLGRRAAELVLDTPWDAPIHEVMSDSVEIVEGGTVRRISGPPPRLPPLVEPDGAEARPVRAR